MLYVRIILKKTLIGLKVELVYNVKREYVYILFEVSFTNYWKQF